MTTPDQVLQQLEALADPDVAREAQRVGIRGVRQWGVTLPKLQALAKSIGKNHPLALALWSASDVQEARLLATMLADPRQVTEALMEAWARDFDTWALVDTCCGYLFDKTPFAYDRALAWSAREEAFVKRAGFVLMAALAVHDKRAPDETLLPFFPVIEREAGDGRNFVKKAVNWALRQLGKRSRLLNAAAIACAQRVGAQDSPSARWIAADALRELQSAKVQGRLKR